MSTDTPEAKELSLVSKVEMRIALQSSDDSLEKTLKTYLAPLLLKLASEFVSVRKKVISICQHINTRIKPQSIKLPVTALLKQYKENHNNLIRHFDILYIQQGVFGLPIDERSNILPTLLHGLCANYHENPQHAAALFNLFLRLLHTMTFPPRGSPHDTDFRNKLDFADKEDDVIFVASWLGKLLLFSNNQTHATRCPGLNKEEFDFLQLYGRKDTWTPSTTGGLNLVETKVVAAKFLASGAFADSERFLPALFASTDSNSRLSDIGDDILKRASSAVSFEDSMIIEQLFQIYLGTEGPEGSLPARIPLKTKIISLLCKSKLASSFVSSSTRIIAEGLAPTVSNQSNGVVPKQGLEMSKLRTQIFSFTNWLARISTPTDLSLFAPNLVGQLRIYIESQGWPRMNPVDGELSSGDLISRAYGYESIGLLAAACPNTLLLEPNLELLRWLFKSLSEDPSGKDVSTSIEHSLSSILGTLGGKLNAELELLLASLLLYQMELPSNDSDGHTMVRSPRYLAVRFANRCLPFANICARWINILAMEGEATERSAILEEGKKGLDPYWYKILNPSKDHVEANELSSELKYRLPSFSELIERIYGPKSFWSSEQVVESTLALHLPNGYTPALTFCRCILMHQALEAVSKPPVIDADWERNIDALLANDEDARSSLKVYLENYFHLEALQTYLNASYNGLISQNGGDVNRAGEYLIELCALLPNDVYSSLSKNLLSLQGPILSTDKALRGTASQVFGILATLEEHPEPVVQKLLTVFEQKSQSWRQAVGVDILQVHGALMAMAYFLSRSSLRRNLPESFTRRRSAFIPILWDILRESRDKILLDAVYLAVSELALFGVLTPETVSGSSNMVDLERMLNEKAKAGKEKAITALGYLAMQFSEGEEINEEDALMDIVKSLYGLHVVRQPEVQFAIGDALCCAAIGWQSKSLIARLDIRGPPPSSPSRKHTVTSILDQVLSDCKTTKPALRQASVIWLLCIVQYCGHLKEVHDRLRECQVAFKGFLADRDSLNQESASRGLTLIYEKGNKALKDDLIRDLVGSLTGSSAGLAGSVSEDTELFDAGALPTGEGSVTTYKDIMSLASEVGDSSLVYKFMSLASSNAIWSSRAAFGRFGLGNILSEASTDGYLSQNPKLYPALYRYRFDPNSNVRSSMNSIWAALVKEPTKTIDTNLDNIVKDLLKNALGREWRVRQASCGALADLIQGRQLEKYEKYLTEIWEVTFKVCDDIKESVRAAAMALARVLTGILTRGLEAGESSSRSAEKMLQQVLPFLLSPSGLESGAPEVQEFSRKTLLKIIKSSNGKTLCPFVPDLVGRLLALLSSIEPEMINYLHLNADKYGLTAQELDDARLKHIRGSSMLEAIERCLDFLDEGSMPELQQSLENAIKTVVGLPSRVGCSRVLVSLSTRQNFVFKPYADHFLTLASKQVFDRNDTISSSYAAACGYLARLSSDGALLKLVESTRQLYFHSEDDRHRVIAGDILYSVSKYATDHFKSLANAILPFVFVAKHDTLDRAQTLFQDTWSENVGGSRTVLLYLREIVNLASQHLDSARWTIKHTSALAIADVVTSTGTGIGDPDAKAICSALEKALSGKAWDGKEVILQALIRFLKNTKFWLADASTAGQIEKIILRESKRNNAAYRQHALGCFGDFVELRDSEDMYAEVYEIVKPAIEESLNELESMDIDAKNGGPSSKTITETTLANASTALLKSINLQRRTGEDLGTSLKQTFELVNRIKSEASSRTALNAIYDAQKSLFERLDLTGSKSLAFVPETIVAEFVHQLFGPGEQVEQTRMKAAEAAVALAPIARRGELTRAALAQNLSFQSTHERSALVQQKLAHAKRILEG